MSKAITSAQRALLEAMQNGVTLRSELIAGRFKAQKKIIRSDTSEDVTSVAQTLRDRGYLRADFTLGKAGWKI